MPMNDDRVDEDVTDKDWLFDYLLSLLRSPQWDISVMGFIDENCAVFDTDDENKLSYTSLHHQFKDLASLADESVMSATVETLCSSSLAEIGISVEDFVDALEASRLSQDISKAVYEQLIAVDDFVTFKKLMVKRNVELELEAVRALQEQRLPIRDGSVDCSITLMEAGGDLKEDGDRGFDEDEGFLLRDGSPQDATEKLNHEGTSELEQQLQRAMEANLRELELMHKREEVEQAELEQAIAMSLALETNHSEPEPTGDGDSEIVKTSGSNDRSVGRSGRTNRGLRQADCKGVDEDRAEYGRSQTKDGYAGSVNDESTYDPVHAEEKLSSSGSRKGDKELKPLPPLSTTRTGGGRGFRPTIDAGGEHFRAPSAESTLRKRRAREASEKAQVLLGERRCAQEVLKGQISEKETAQRERHLKDMRDRIVSAKRAEREEQALIAKVTPVDVQSDDAPQRGGSVSSGGETKRGEEGVLVVNGEDVEEDFADEQRRAMRVALARRMKRELVESERDRLTKVRENQFADLNDKLRSVEKLRDENSEKEAEIAEVLLHQQRQRAQNVARSAAAAQRNDKEEFTFGERG